MLNKRADIGETITWIIATIVVVIILLLSFYASGLVAKYKKLSAPEGKIYIENQNQHELFSSNLFKSKTDMALKIKF